MRFKASTETKAPIDVAFLHLADPDLLATWVPNMKDFHFSAISDDGNLLGARFHYRAENGQSVVIV